MLFRQFIDEDLGCASYLVGDATAGVAVLVDPPFAVEPLLEAAADAGVTVVRVLETHTHADHVSGHGRLALDRAIPVSIHPLAEPEYRFHPLADGDTIPVGGVEIRVLHTPGHRPEHCSFVVDEELALTGDSLFVGDAARPDLAVAAREGATDLFHSLRRLTELPPDVEVYPGHVAGSLCGGGMKPDRSSTIGAERADNQALAYEDLQDFVLASASISTPRPPTTERVVALNRGPWLPLPPAPAELPDVGEATVLDVRPVAAYLAGHLPGAISVPLDGGSFGTKAGFVLDPDEPVVLHASSGDEALAAARRLWAVGVLSVAGYVVSAAATETLATIDVPELKRLLDADAVQLVDVREQSERDSGYIPGSRSIPYRLLRKSGSDALDATKPVVTICETGARAAIAASLLEREGLDVRVVLDGGVRDFELVGFRRCGS
ncbi:MAG TPA: MBL fold metallo-hydrolase [Gaiellaceae bacterium]|jgi:glyoxylase-like metal-dependent hydrolase (beta-lactamase superfamily II)/rhodanese-related sulfurtransferase|nr:MBL fold metallo-hydrolase [Gaiellaceae bacterium]